MYYERYFDEDFKEARKYWDEHNLGDVNEQIDIMLGKRKGKYLVKFTDEPLTNSFEEELSEMCNQLLGYVDADWMEGEITNVLGTTLWLEICSSIAKQFKNGLIKLANQELKNQND